MEDNAAYMITCIEEIREVKNIIAYIKNEFDKNGIDMIKILKSEL